MRKGAGIALALAFAVAVSAVAMAKEPDGVTVSRKSVFRFVVGAEKIESQAGLQYEQMTRQAYQKQALLPETHPTVQRLRKIAKDLLPGATKFNERAKDWKWEVNVLASKQINAFCMPGGKIAFFTGIIDQLQLTDDEIAMVMGHEIGHALWEHARERAGKQMALGAGRVVAGLIFGQLGDIVGAGAGSLAQVVNAALGNQARFDKMKSFFEGVGEGYSAGVWEKPPVDRPEFKAKFAAKRIAAAKAEEAVGV